MKKKRIIKGMYDYMIPTIIEKTRDGERAYDIYSRLLKDRIIFINDEIDGPLTINVIAQLLFLEKESTEKDIYIYISSGGGSIDDGLAIFDVMNHIKPNIVTVSLGMVASMATFILAAGTKGKRFALPNSRIMIHQAGVGNIGGKAADVQIYAKNLLKINDQIISYLMQFTGQKRAQIEKDIDRDHWMNAQEALDYGLVDDILQYNSFPGKPTWKPIMS